MNVHPISEVSFSTASDLSVARTDPQETEAKGSPPAQTLADITTQEAGFQLATHLLQTFTIDYQTWSNRLVSVIPVQSWESL
ncbi:MAG: hypothetical protein WKF77_23000 [Planctomycetaceae bacterium]